MSIDMTPDLSVWLTTSQAARIVGISERRMMQLADAGQVEHISTANGRLYSPASVERLRAARQQAEARCA